MGRAVSQVASREGAQVVVVDWNADAAQETLATLTGTGLTLLTLLFELAPFQAARDTWWWRRMSQRVRLSTD